MEICVTWGIGTGATREAAFDAALFDAGIANYNLLRMTSVIPPRCRVVLKKTSQNNLELGHRLYVVMSSAATTHRGQAVFAGLAWQYSENTGGVFAEYRGDDEHAVARVLSESLASMNRYRSIPGKPTQKIVGAVCNGEPICVLVAAVYASEGWG